MTNYLSMFGIFGYLSVVLWFTVPLLWWLHSKKRPRRWICHYALLIAFVALLLSELNSRLYVNRIQIDQSEAIAAAQARQAEARQKAEDERADDVAQIRFAEDDRTDFLDMGGLDDADRKYIESMTETDDSAVPAWKRQKRERSSSPADDGSLESELDTTEEAGGVETGLGESGKDAIVLPENLYMLANRLDGLNLKWVRFLFLLSIGIVIADYLKRGNIVDECYFPLPLPSILYNGMTPLPAICPVSVTGLEDRLADLTSLVRKGETFIYVTGDAEQASAIPDALPRLPKSLALFEVIHVDQDEGLIDDQFVFEGAWYNRAAFVIGTTERIESFLGSIYQSLVEYRHTRACVRQNVHIVWDLDVPVSDALHEDVIQLIHASGISIREYSSPA